MILENISLSDYRNYESVSLDFDKGVNVLYGNNAQGKTNILEAIYLSCTTKSHRKARDDEIIRFEKDEAHIRLSLKKNEIGYRIDMHLKRHFRKTAAVNSQPVRKSSELLGTANIVLFSPEDLALIKNGPAERRRFIDLEASQIDSKYLDDLVRYNKCLDQRNHLLKNMSMNGGSKRDFNGTSDFGSVYRAFDGTFDELSVWDEKLLYHGMGLIESREKFIGQLNEIIGPIHESLTGDDKRIEIRYAPSVGKDDFKKALEDKRRSDLKYGSTSIGPHRDDIVFVLSGRDLRKYGSQGQQRTVSLALKLSEIELAKRRTGENPVLLLDDVLSELDSNRQKFLLTSIGGIQTIITCTGLDEFVKNNFDIDKVFLVHDNHCEEMGINQE